MPKNLLWIDFETTGLPTATPAVVSWKTAYPLEVAAVVTDAELTIVAETGPIAIDATKSQLADMHTWARKTHAESGLLERIELGQGKTLSEVDRLLCDFAAQHMSQGAWMIAGQSVGSFDRQIISAYLPFLDAGCHHRVFDASTLATAAQATSGQDPRDLARQTSSYTHRADDDVRSSIALAKISLSLLGQSRGARV